ncbi:hypothetical protein GCM10027037_05430 [Mucilaginibacter koreensis]
MASHELKTPLTSLKGFLQVLGKRKSIENDDFCRNILKSSERQVFKMQNIINGFLNMSRLESGKLQLNLQSINLLETITTTIEEFRLLQPGVNISFEPGETVVLNLDKEKIEHVLINLFSNAVKYSKKDSAIFVGYQSDSNIVTIYVKDQGIGIKENEIDKIFERFYRSQEAKDKHIAGFGIGLYLCHEIINLHNGRIDVVSTPGEGSNFVITLPLNL